MRVHTHALTPGGVSAGTRGEMAAVRAYDTKVALSETLEAGIAVTLSKALAGCGATMLTGNPAGELESDSLSQYWIQGRIARIQGK